MPRPTGPESASAALRANLAETRREVDVPPRYQALRDPVERYFGVRKAVESVTTEFFHPLRNVEAIVDGLKELCGGMFHYFERDPDRAHYATLLDELFRELYTENPAERVLRSLVGTHLQFVITLLESDYRIGYGDVVEQSVEGLKGIQETHGAVFLSYSGYLRRAVSRLSANGATADGLLGLYEQTVTMAHQVFRHQVDLMTWSRECGAPEVTTKVAIPLDEELRVPEHGVDLRSVLDRPNNDDLLSFVLRRGSDVENAVERVALLVRLSAVRELGYRGLEILRALSSLLRTVCASGSSRDIAHAVDLITDHLTTCESEHKGILYDCLETLGSGIAQRADYKLTAHFVKRVISVGFESPQIRGVSEEWEVWVNPHHLQCLRCWLRIIENDPQRYERLLSALVIHLSFNGLFVSDTDLFQRDVSALLNSDVADAFSLIMQLVQLFPVFFNEVGSEGELREVSTRIDQLVHRRDPLIHFLRKQSHAESNNRLVGFARAVYRYWRTGTSECLAEHLPPAVLAAADEKTDWFTGVHAVTVDLDRAREWTEDSLDEIDLVELQTTLDDRQVGSDVDRERVSLLVQMFRLLKAKYSYEAEQLLPMLERSTLIPQELRERLAAACESPDPLDVVRAGNRVLAELKKVITATEITESFENIYHKRHIAAGIPSMYGTYHEPKFDAMGLMIRLMRFLKPHLESCVADFDSRYITRSALRRAQQIMDQMVEGLRIGGLRVRNLASGLDLLRRGVARQALSAGQYLNLFSLMSEALDDVVDTNYLALHDPGLGRIARQVAKAGAVADGDLDTEINRMSEEFLRSVISSTYAIQELDLFLHRIQDSLRAMTDALGDRGSEVVLSYLPPRLVSFLGRPIQAHEDQLYLGYKGFAIKHLRSLGLPVPEGFVVSTELFGIRDALNWDELRVDTGHRIETAVRQLEQETGLELGNPRRPMLLSVRSGSAFSMPGMMDTILNVGLNQHLLDRLSMESEYAWTAWDCYRRYLQGIAMSCGVDRDLFDEIMVRYKRRHRVALKVQFTAEQMREMALEYRRLGEEHEVPYVDDLLDQLQQAVTLVLDSWDKEPAQVFRRQMGLSDGWGTAVLVQRMVYGNLGPGAGSGVVFTRDPGAPSTGIELFGDFTSCSQGEDVVGGLVHPLPISEAQRHRYSPHLRESLEARFPGVYSRLATIADMLINDHGFEHQEIEFTFESEDPESLFLLQTRPMRLLRRRDAPSFADTESLEQALLGVGIGVGGGAMSGAVAFTAEDIAALRAAEPDVDVILLRPDTVPEDIPLVLAVNGLLTTRGGFTSHAAVTAKRLGKCCVVNCREMVVDENARFARIGHHTLYPGDRLSIDGTRGSVFSGAQRVIVKTVVE